MTASDLERRLAELEATVERQTERIEASDTDSSGNGISRRTVLQALGVVGLGSYATGSASADPQGQLGTASRPVETIYAHRLAGDLTDETPITSLVGTGLFVDEGTLRTRVADATNLGEGDGVLAEIANGTLGFRSLKAGKNVRIGENQEHLVVEASDSDTNNDATNLGNGTGLYTGRKGSTLEFRSLIGGSNVSLATSNGEVTIDAVSASGETNTASNVGTGKGVFKQKSDVDLEFKSLVGGTNLSITAGTDTLTLDAANTYSSVSDGGTTVVSDASDVDFASNLAVTDDGDGTVTVDSTAEANTASNVGTGKGTFKQKVGSDLEFKSLVGGTNLSITAGTDALTLDASATYPSTSDSGTIVLSNPSDINFGTNLSVTDDTDGTVTVDASSMYASISDDGTTVVSGASDVNFASVLSVTDDGDGTVTVDGPWADGDGDTLLEPRSGTGYTGIDLSGVSGAQVVTPWVGTSTATAFEAFVNSSRVAHFGTTGTDFSGDTAAGNVLLGQYASVADGPLGAVVSGGGSPTSSHENVVADDYGTVSGGENNQAGSIDTDTSTSPYATVGGGIDNVASTNGATVAGGEKNVAKGADQSTVAGGYQNTANGWRATVGGGNGNTASNSEATVAGGLSNSVPAAWATVGGGDSNGAYDDYGTVAGGRSNQAGTNDGNTTTAKYATVGGGYQNEALAWYATIAGGGPTDTANPATTNNVVYDSYGTIGGGGGNQAGTDDGNKDSSGYATVGGGHRNTASGQDSTIAGGSDNSTIAYRSFVGGGNNNTASGDYGVVPGGLNNTAGGLHSFAAGRAASADHAGAFAFGDSTSFGVSTSAADQFVVQAGGGAIIHSASDTSTNTGVELAAGSGSWSSLSTASVKSNFEPIDTQGVLDRLLNVDIKRWEYDQEEDGVTHMGPIAEQFYDAFGLGPDDEHITNIDADGVAFAAIQGVADRVKQLERDLTSRDERIEEFEAERAAREDRIDDLEDELESKDERIDHLEERLADIEQALDGCE